MLKIWGRVNSVNVQKVLWAVTELSVPFERTDAGMQFGVVNTPEYRRLNPNGRVPTIEDDGLVLWESNAIVRYLYAKHGPAQTPAERAVGDKWMDWAITTPAAPITALFWGYIRTPPEKRDAAALAASLKQAAELLAIADAALAATPFLSGKDFGMGDIPLGCFVNRWFKMPLERPAMNHLAAWYERLQTRPGYREHVMLPLS